GLAAAALGHRAEARVGLEQERPAARAADRQVDLEQLLVVALEPVLGARQIGDLGLRPSGAECLELLLFEREPLADQPRLVRPEDAAGGRPDLHPHHRLAYDALERALHSPLRRRVATV